MIPSAIIVDGKIVSFEELSTVPANIRHEIAKRLLFHPNVRHAEPSMLLSMDDEVTRPSARLLEIAAILARAVPNAVHPLLSRRSGGSPRWFDVFPGEHYHMLTTLTNVLKPRTVWEFGTDTGMGTVALLEGMGQGGVIYTVDLDPISKKCNPWLNLQDLDSGSIKQVVSDMKAPELFSRFEQQLAAADLIFVDGPKDGFTEVTFLDLLSKVPFLHSPLIVFDDIRLMNMLGPWRAIKQAKMDLTSFGHWSGTGLVDWCTQQKTSMDE